MQAKYTLSICAIVRNEARYILEWIAFHKAIGVDHFYIYDNQSTDDTTDILLRLEAAGLVTLTSWPDSTPAVVESGLGPQVPAYNDFLKYRDQTEWVGYIDVDEFLVLRDVDNVQEWLSHYDDCAAVGINWRIFGSSGYEHYADELVIERFTHRAPVAFGANRHVKTFARTALIERANCHISYMRNRPVVDIFKRPINNAHDGVHDEVCDGAVQLNHYFVRSRGEWELKRARGRATRANEDQVKFRNQREFEEHDRNEVDDLGALRFRDRTVCNLSLLGDLMKFPA
jgi:Glycosyltransferase family 92